MIPKIAHKGNIRLEALAIPAIVVLVGLSAFGLGRLSAQSSPKVAPAAGQEAKTSITTAGAVY